MRRNSRSKLMIETLEARQLLAADLHNFLAPLDVNDDGRVNSIDALLIINELNTRNLLSSGESKSSSFVDVNDDGRVSAVDALTVINSLNRRIMDDSQATDPWIRISGEGSTQAAVQLKSSDDGIELEIRMRGILEDQSHAVFLEDTWIGAIEIDGRGRGHIRLHPGDGLDGQLPDLLASGRQLVNLKIDGVGEVFLHNNASDDLNSSQAADSRRMSHSSVFGARLMNDGETRGHALVAEHGQRKFLGVFARGLTPGTFYRVAVDRVEVATLQANRAGVVIGRIDTSQIENIPVVQAGTRIRVGDYSGEFIALGDRPRPDPPKNIYVAQFSREGILGGAELILSEDRTVLNLRLGRVESSGEYELFIDDVKIAEVRAGRAGIIEFRYDSRQGDTLLAPIPTLHRESVLRVGTVARARLVKVV